MEDVDERDALVQLERKFKAMLLKQASSSHLDWWLKEQGASHQMAEAFRAQARTEGTWVPWDVGDQRVAYETKRIAAGYRDAAQTIRSVTMRPTTKSTLIALLLLGAVTLSITMKALNHSGSLLQNLARWFSPLTFMVDLPAFLLGASLLMQSLWPDRIELHRNRLVSLRRGKEKAVVPRDEVAFIDVRTVFEQKLKGTRGEWKMFVHALLYRMQGQSWLVYAQKRDGTEVVLAEHVDEKLAKAAAIELEDQLELESGPALRVRLEPRESAESPEESEEELDEAEQRASERESAARSGSG